MKKPHWLNKKINLNHCCEMKQFLRKSDIVTVCEESRCPNISECFSNKVATFMILGSICSRKCSFCAVTKGVPTAIDSFEPKRVAKAVESLNLNYVVITSPCRDDLADGGASIFAETVAEIKKLSFSKKIEILIPDFAGNREAIENVCSALADVISHNIETVPSLYVKVRNGADYRRSLEVLRLVKEFNKKIFTKSGLMLGLGETEDEVIDAFRDLKKAGCDFLTLGQYLAPSAKHYSVKEYITPERFVYFEKKAYALGFVKVKSSPYVRSSYLAHDFLKN